MVEIFKTNVQEATQASTLIALLLQHFPDSTINFDLEDCDKVLRVEGAGLIAEKVVALVEAKGYICGLLE